MRRLGALGALVLAGLLVVGCASDEGQAGAPEVTESTSSDGSPSSSVLLDAPEDVGTGRCMAPTAEVLAQADVAFDGTVRSIEHGLVDLEVTQWYVGGEGDLAKVRAQPAAMQALIGAVAFEEGGRFLVAGQGGDLMVCGFSAPYDDALAGLYAEAFGG